MKKFLIASAGVITTGIVAAYALTALAAVYYYNIPCSTIYPGLQVTVGTSSVFFDCPVGGHQTVFIQTPPYQPLF